MGLSELDVAKHRFDKLSESWMIKKPLFDTVESGVTKENQTVMSEHSDEISSSHQWP